MVPSIFPEAFGMVAAEAAAAGSLPLVANHSGLAEIAAGVAAEYPEADRDLTSFRSAPPPSTVRRVLPPPPPAGSGRARPPRRAVVANWSWTGVAQRLLKPFA